MDDFSLWQQIGLLLREKLEAILFVILSAFVGLTGGLVKFFQEIKSGKARAITLLSFSTVCFVAFSMGAAVGFMFYEIPNHGYALGGAFALGYIGSKPLDLLESNLEKIFKHFVEKWTK